MPHLAISKNLNKNFNQINESIFKVQLNNVIQTAKTKYNFTAMELSISPVNKTQAPLNIYYGNTSKSSGQPINADSIFQVGSITKTFTSSAILNLINEHKIKLTDTVDKFLPQYKSWGNITISQLINQTSGIYDYTNSFLWWTRLYLFSFLNWNSTELLAIAYGKSYFEPSQGWHYSNTNYVILGLIIEKITQQKLANYFTQHFLQTRYMSLNRTHYIIDNPSSNIKNNLAHGYYNNGADMTNINTSWLQSAGAMLSNANDLTKWYLFYGQQVINNKFVLNQFVDIINGKHLSDSSHIGYGFGTFSIPTPYGVLFLTPGLTLGYTSLAGYLPCKNISFSYIITNGFKRQNIHQYVLSKILPIIIQNTPDTNSISECQKKAKSKEIVFPNF
ncbi:MAG: class A beta-lactamase-related serine hydrolase [Bacteroidia bacterium]|nr:MAG: class A beta-lactamase-related serine hydrolase [Bacteroidia bacterium]